MSSAQRDIEQSYYYKYHRFGSQVHLFLSIPMNLPSFCTYTAGEKCMRIYGNDMSRNACVSESSFNLFPSLLSKSRLLAIAEAFFLLTVILSPVNFVLLHNLQRRSSDQLSTWHTGSPQRTWYNIEHTRGGRGYQHFLISCITYI